MSPSTSVVDVRRMAPWHRLPMVLSAFDALAPGEAMELVVELDPWPLHGYLDASRAEQCVWEVLENGPAVWRVRLSRRA